MSDPVLMNSFNYLRKRDKMQGLPRLILLFRYEFNDFHNTGAL